MFKLSQRIVLHHANFAKSNYSRLSSSLGHFTAMETNQDYRQKHSKLFNQSFDKILSQLTDNEFNKVSEELFKANQWLRKVIEYNVPTGKLNRGLLTVLTFDLLAKPQMKTDEWMERARALGWAIELFQTFFLLLDDIMDKSITRRGQPCWYRNDYVGLMACNDATLVETGMITLIRNNFKGQPSYIDIVELFQDIFKNTAYGQCMDMMSNPEGCAPDLRIYTPKRWEVIVKYKTAYYTIVFPVRAAMYAAGCSSAKDHMMVEQILLEIGILFQAQDDFLDFFCDSSITGKIGTDVEDGKCSWNIVTALSVCSEEQRQVLQQNYGRKDTQSVNRVKEIYADIGLKAVFEDYENREYEAIMTLIDKFAKESNISKRIFDEPLRIITKRRR